MTLTFVLDFVARSRQPLRYIRRWTVTDRGLVPMDHQ